MRMCQEFETELKEFGKKSDQLQREKERMSEKYGIVSDTFVNGDSKVTRMQFGGIAQKQQQMKDMQFEFYKVLNKQ